MKYVATIALLLGLFMSPVTAHDPSKHKGKAIEGEITAATGDQVELKTAAGVVHVSLTSKTKIEHGDQTVDRSHLKTGERVSVFGTKLPSGQLVAREIVIAAPGHSGGSHGKPTRGSAKK